MGRLSAWTMGLIALGLFAWTNGWPLQFCPWGPTPDPTWGQYLFFWVMPIAFIWLPLPGLWLLGAARVLGGGWWGWRWWVGGALALRYLMTIYELPQGYLRRDLFPGFVLANMAQALLAIWPVFYWGMRWADRRKSARTVAAA